MKRILILSLVAWSFKANAQRNTDSTLTQKKVIRTITKNPVTRQPATAPATQPTLTPPKGITQTATGMINTTQPSATQSPNPPAQTNTTTNTNTTPAPLPDIIITNISFLANTASTYFVNYTLKNVGTNSVKKGLLGTQSYINGDAAGGAVTTSVGSEINQLLNPGESINGRQTFSVTGRVPNTPYTFQLNTNGTKVNAGTASEAWVGQQFNELNYSNNIIQTTFIIPPPPPAPADVEVSITAITKSPMDTAGFVRIYYTVKNIGETAIPQNANLSIQTRVEDTDNNPATFIGTACCGQPTGGGNLAADEIPFAPGQMKNNYYDAKISAGYYPALVTNTSYKFSVEVSNTGFTDDNNANNKNSFIYFLQ